MELRDRIIAGIATLDEGRDTVEVDGSALLHRLLLFDQVVIKSIRLKELPALVQLFGLDGLLQLLESGALAIICEALTVGSIGQMGILESRQAKGVLPLGSYSFAIVREGDRRQYLHDCLQEAHSADIGDRDAIKLKRTVVESILDPTVPEGVEDALVADAANHRGLVVQALQSAIAERGRGAPPAEDLNLQVHQIDAQDLRVETNLQDLLKVDLSGEHELVQRALLGIGGLNLRIATMKAHQGVETFEEGDLPLFESKLSFLARDLLPDDQERRLDRILEVADLPDVDMSEAQAIDVERLQNLRASPECREFRSWLRESEWDVRRPVAGAVAGTTRTARTGHSLTG